MAYSRSLFDFALIMSGISAIGNTSSPAISAWMMDLIPEHRRTSVSGVTQRINGIGLSVGPTAGSYTWNSTKPDTAVPCGIAAIIFATALPFYLMLKDSRVHENLFRGHIAKKVLISSSLPTIRIFKEDA